MSADSSAGMVGEHFLCVEVAAARRGGAQGRENVGMSSHNPNEKLGPRKSKVSVALAINHGLGGPKAMAKAAADGQTVNIPSPPFPSREGQSAVGPVPYWFGIRGVRVLVWQIRRAVFNGISKRSG